MRFLRARWSWVVLAGLAVGLMARGAQPTMPLEEEVHLDDLVRFKLPNAWR